MEHDNLWKGKRNLYRRRITFVSLGGATEVIEDVRVDPGKLFITKRISVENITSDFTSLRIGTYSGNVFFPYEEEKNPKKETLYWTPEELIVGEGEKIRIEIKGATAGDRIDVYITSYWIATQDEERS